MLKANSLKSTHTGILRIGDIEIPCHVLEDGRRVISGRGMQSSLGFSRTASGVELARIVDTKLRNYLSPEIVSKLKNPLKFEGNAPLVMAKETHGHEAAILVDICDAFIEARKRGVLSETQKNYANYAEIIIRSVAKVGIIALIDEATGYQEIRDRKALEAILDKYLRKELAAWAKRFPDDFYQEMFRLRKWVYEPSKVARPGVVGRYTNDIVYERLAPNILDELERKNPKNENGHRSSRHHQWLSDEIGHPALSQHLHAVIGLMRASSNWDIFYRMLQRAFPKKGKFLKS